MKKIIALSLVLASCQMSTEVPPPAEVFVPANPVRVSYALSVPSSDEQARVFGKTEEDEKARQDAMWAATLAGGSAALPVTRMLSTSSESVEAIILQAEQLMAACDGPGCSVTEQVIALEFLNTYFAKGKLFSVEPEHFEIASLDSEARRAVAFAVRLLVRNETHHAHLVAASLVAAGDAISAAEQAALALQGIRSAEAFLDAPPCETCASGKRSASDDEARIRRGIAQLRALLG